MGLLCLPEKLYCNFTFITLFEVVAMLRNIKDLNIIYSKKRASLAHLSKKRETLKKKLSRGEKKKAPDFRDLHGSLRTG